MRIDLHVHSSVSDGTDTPTQLVFKALAADLDVIGLTDHDTFDGVPEATEAAKRVGLTVLPGMEMSCQVDGVSVHLLGYGCDPYHRPLVQELAKVRVGRSGRIQAVCDKLTELGLPLTVDEVMEQAAASPSVGRPHIADAMVEKGYVATRDEAFAKYLADDKPAYVGRYATPLEDAIALVHEARGCAVIAHPWARESRAVLPAEYLTALARDHGLEGIEVHHPDHDEATRELLFQLGERVGLVRTGASDYHGHGKVDHELGCELTRPSAYNDLVKKIKARHGVL